MDESRRPLWVPVRESEAGTVSPLLGRLPGGPRTGLAFTSITALGEGCRPGQPWIRLSEPALRALLGPLGITRIQLDPVLIVADLDRPAVTRNVPAHASRR